MLAEYAAQMIEKHQLTFPVLLDPGNRLAKQFGLVHVLPPDLRQVYLGFSLDVPKYNGDDSWSLPLAARYIVRPDGTIHHAHVDTDHTRRPEPREVIDILQSLQGA
jgi:peroxiredoxin